MTDTGAYTDVVFGLFWLLGYRFSPRIADIGRGRYWRIDPTADYGCLNGIARHRVNINLIKEYAAETRPPISRAIDPSFINTVALWNRLIWRRLPSICGCRRSASWPQKRPKTICSIAAWPRESYRSRASANPAPGQGTGSAGNRRDLLAQPEIETTGGKRDRAILAVLLGCALRRSELAALDCGHIQQRNGRWVFVDLVGKGKRVRTLPIPLFVKVAIDAWTAAAGLSEGPLFRRVRRREYPEKALTALRERMICTRRRTRR